MNSVTSTTVCEYCGAPIDANEWYLVETDVTADGTLVFYAFCNDRCRSAWAE